MKSKAFSVYMITSEVAGKSYVGITSQKLERRWKAHCRDAANGRGFLLHAAIRKYGQDQFLIRVLDTASSWDEACQMERMAISKYGTFGERGYNLTAGGDGAPGREKSADTRAVHSAAAKNQWAEEASRQRMVESLKAGWANPDAKARLRAALKASGTRPEVKARRSAAMKKRMADTKEQVRISAKKRANKPEAVALQSARMTQHWQDPAAMARQVECMKRMWADPEKKERIRESLRKAWIARKARESAPPQGAQP